MADGFPCRSDAFAPILSGYLWPFAILIVHGAFKEDFYNISRFFEFEEDLDYLGEVVVERVLKIDGLYQGASLVKISKPLSPINQSLAKPRPCNFPPLVSSELGG